MGTIKDLVDLVTKLNDSVQDRKFAAELREIQRMIFAFQSEHFNLAEKYHNLLSENADLKQTILSLKGHKEEPNQNKPQVNKNISEESAQILKSLIDREDVTPNEIVHLTSLPLVRVEYWLEKLESDGFVYMALFMGQPPQYSLAQNGREYLIENGHI